MSNAPSPTADNGRTDHGRDGRFLPGNRAARGNPFARKVGQLRSAMLRSVKASDVKAVVVKLVEMAKSGDVQAARLLLDRCLGPAGAVDLIERLEVLEQEASTWVCETD